MSTLNHPATTERVHARSDEGTGIFGTGLGAWDWTVLLLGSSLFFVFWGGPFWAQSPESSHFWRSVGSYLVVFPVAALLLAARRRLTVYGVVTTLFTACAAELVVAAACFMLFAPCTALSYEPAKARQGPKTSVANSVYRALKADYPRGDVLLSVTHREAPVEGAIIRVDGPSAGARLPAPRIHEVAWGGPAPPNPPPATVDDAHSVLVADSSLPTRHLLSEGRAARTI